MKKSKWFLPAAFLALLTGCAGGKDKTVQQKPERTILFVIDGMTSGLHQKAAMPAFTALADSGVLFREVWLPLPAHPAKSDAYPWTCSIPNPVLMSGTVFIGQDSVNRNFIQHSFTERPTGFFVNSVSYVAIKDGFTIYEQLPKGEMKPHYTDEVSVEAAKKSILADNPEFIRIHCQGLGSAGSRNKEEGHPYTNNIWYPDSPYLRQAAYTDGVLGQFVQWLKDNDLWDGTVLIVMGDHGQADAGWHEPYMPGGRTTQMVVAGSGIKKGEIYDYAEIIDVAPTIAWLQNVPAPKFSCGRALKEVKEGEAVPARVPQRMKALDEALQKCHDAGIDVSGTPGLSVEQICKWHLEPQGTDFAAFVDAQVARADELVRNKK